MVTSLDGKVTGDFLSSKSAEGAVEAYYDINRRLKSGGFICGRVTMEESFTKGWYPDLTKYEPVRPDPEPMNFWLDDEYMSGFYAIAFDPKGRLGWRGSTIIDEDPGYDGAQIIEVLTEQADERYLAYLQEVGIPYIFAGKDEIDVELALRLLADHIGNGPLLLEGGSVINGSFQRAGVIDEISLVVAGISGERDDKPLFYGGVSESYELVDSEILNGCVWLKYKKEI